MANRQRREAADYVKSEVRRLEANGLKTEDAEALAHDPEWLERPSIAEEMDKKS